MKRDSVSTTIPQAFSPIHYERSQLWANGGAGSAALRRSLVSPAYMAVAVDDVFYYQSAAQTLDLDAAASWDTQTPTDYAVAANRAGVQFYVYAVPPSTGVIPKLICSAAATYPDGYTADNSRKIASFHCICLSVGTIASHGLTGYITGDIIPRSVQDILHRPAPGFMPGMVWAGVTDFDTRLGPAIWVQIYLTSGTGANTASAFGGTISDNRIWNDFVDDFAAIGCRMLTDEEFSTIALGSNEETNIAGSADPVTTGGHVDTASRRMVSHIGCEDCCGAMWQWLSDQSYRYDADGSVVAGSQTATITYVASLEGAPVYLKSAGPEYVLVADIADDVWITVGSHKFLIFADADPSIGGVKVYFDDDGTQPNRLYAAVPSGKNAMLRTTHRDYSLIVAYHATPASVGVELRYDNVTHNRLEAINASGVNATIDLAIAGIAWAYYDLPGAKGSLYRQGTYGDVKLRAGGHWTYGANAGSRCRAAADYRWTTSSSIGGRGCADPV